MLWVMRRRAPATERNREPILEVLTRVMPREASVLEIASGTGEHAAYLADRLPVASWQPTDPDPEARASIDAWREGTRVLPALALDVRSRPWPVTRADAIVCINMIHISPWEATKGLMRGAAKVLANATHTPPVLYTYGAYKRGGQHTAPSNEAFDAWLKERDESYGVRDLEAVEAVANAAGFRLREITEMPANNLSLVFEL
jgi:Protein of unknown function (DUF938)